MSINLPNGNIRVMGDGITVDDDFEEVTLNTCIVIQFDSREEMKAALEAGACRISFPDEPDIPLSPECKDDEAA